MGHVRDGFGAARAGLVALCLTVCNCSFAPTDVGKQAAGVAEDVSNPRRAAEALLRETGAEAIAQARTALQDRDKNIDTVKSVLAPGSGEPMLGTNPVIPCFADAA